MKIIIVNKSDSTGGAAVVSRRLMHALRAAGADARMLVAEKRTADPNVTLAASPRDLKRAFLTERLSIFIHNGMQRDTLFKIDTGAKGVDITRHPWMEGADAVILNWVNQGMLSLQDIRKIAERGIPIIWTMHDMWCFTGICHHSGECTRYREECGRCPLMKHVAFTHDLSRRTLERKLALYQHVEGKVPLRFVAVSSWLKDLAATSTLLRSNPPVVIPNAFPLRHHAKAPLPTQPQDAGAISDDKSQHHKRDEAHTDRNEAHTDTLEILFGAARLDDPIKGWPLLEATIQALRTHHPELAAKTHLRLFGDIRNASLLQNLAVRHTHLGTIYNPDEIERLYRSSHILVSTSGYETLPGTLVEAQAYGAIPVSTSRGGQRDIVEHRRTGWLVDFAPSDDITLTARRMADAIAEAAAVAHNAELRTAMQEEMLRSVKEKFSEESVAASYLRLIQEMKAEMET